MRNLFLFLAKYGHFILFLGLEIICFSLIVRFNDSQKETWLHTAGLYTGKINQKISDANEYLFLQETNDSLQSENARLLQQIIDFKVDFADNAYQNFELKDTSITKVIPARICNKTIHLRNNFITISKGSSNGIKKGMGVISQNGIVGIVKSVSNHYADVLLILHSLSRTSVSVKNKDYFGNMVWKSQSTKRVQVEAIPKYAELNVGDTIITSGYSNVFPLGLEIGKIASFEAEQGGSNYLIDVDLFNDLELIQHVYVIEIEKGEEIESLHSSKEKG